jgi:hypothetical protein
MGIPIGRDRINNKDLGFRQIDLEGEAFIAVDPTAPYSSFLEMGDDSTTYTFSVMEAEDLYHLLGEYFSNPPRAA